MDFLRLPLLLFVAVAADKTDLEADVAVITDDSIQHVLDDSHERIWLLEFYAPW